MTDEEFEALKARIKAGAEHAQSPTGQWFQRATKAWMEGREAPPVPERAPAERGPRSEREQRLAAGLIFSDRDQQHAEAAAEDRLRRRQADAEVAQRDHLWQALRDLEGPEYADEWMSGESA